MPKVSEEHREGRRQQILAAASRCFAREGLRRTSMQDIISESGLSAGAIYGYFKGKEEIFEALANLRHAREAEVFGEVVSSAGLTEALARLSRSFIGGLDDREQRLERVVSIDLWAESLRNPRLMEIVRRGVDQPRGVFIEIISAAQERGELADGLDPEALARIVIAAFHGLVLQQAWDDQFDIQAVLVTIRALAEAAVGPSRSQGARPRRRPPSR